MMIEVSRDYIRTSSFFMTVIPDDGFYLNKIAIAMILSSKRFQQKGNELR